MRPNHLEIVPLFHMLNLALCLRTWEAGNKVYFQEGQLRNKVQSSWEKKACWQSSSPPGRTTPFPLPSVNQFFYTQHYASERFNILILLHSYLHCISTMVDVTIYVLPSHFWTLIRNSLCIPRSFTKRFFQLQLEDRPNSFTVSLPSKLILWRSTH